MLIIRVEAYYNVKRQVPGMSVWNYWTSGGSLVHH